MKIPLVRLDSNENPYGPSPKAVLAAVDSLKHVSRYPRGIRDLEEKIASSLGVDPEGVISSSGADRIIELVMRFLGKSAKRMLLPIPGFRMYEYLSDALRLSATYVTLPVAKYSGLLANVRRGDLVVLGSPNNPDGKMLERSMLEELLQSCSWVVLDEAYAEYARHSFAGLTTRYPNLIVIKTFSKAYGLAGLRVGCLLAARDVTKRIRPLAGPYEVSSTGVEACKAALDDRAYYDKVVELTCRNRSKLEKDLDGIEFLTVFPSHGNFLLFQLFNSDAREVYDALKQRNVLIRNCKGWRGLEGEFLRVTIGSRSELSVFFSSLREVLRND